MRGFSSNMELAAQRAVAVAFVAMVFFLGGVSSSKAQSFSVQISVDENGNGSFTNSAGFLSSLPSALQADPGPGGLSSALTYDLMNPPGLTDGDLLINEFGTSTIGDVIRFNSGEIGAGGGTGALVFYSLDSFGSLADTGGPGSDYTNLLTLTEDAAGQLSYTPTSGQPGFVAGAGGPVTYLIASDETSVPEPASMLLFGCGLAGVGLVRRRKN